VKTYVDASVLLRVVLGEANALAEWKEIESVSSVLVRVESLRVVDRAALSFRLDDDAATTARSDVIAALRTFQMAPLSDAVLERAADPFPSTLGTLDAIHLATALLVRADHPDLRLATHDAELALAARAMGFEVIGA
jgi:predicted nucleic acid-binding protein